MHEDDENNIDQKPKSSTRRQWITFHDGTCKETRAASKLPSGLHEPGMSRLPIYAVCSPEAAERHAEATRRGDYNLINFERQWRARYVHLQERGYELRPRYHPDWKPSWTGTNRVPTFCEDSIPSLVSFFSNLVLYTY